MKPSRRSLFQFAGGAMAGTLFTPAPWRLLTDAALWSENWPGIPQPLRGEIRARFTHCALCPAGCTVRARCVGDQPVSLAGVNGGLCPFGTAAHHLPYHPARLRTGPAAEDVAAAIAKRGTQGIALLDLNPGRTASWTYRRAMQALNGTYLAETECGVIDLHAARTVLSFGVPVLEGWGTPANVLAARDHFRLIQVEAVESGTAMLADQWLPIAPGTEAAVARGIMQAFQQDSPTGLAGELAANGPSVVLGDLPEVSEINELLGAYGKTIIASPEAPVPDAWRKSAAPITQLAGVPDHSIQILLIDEASAVNYIPWHRIARKLVPGNSLVVTFTSGRGGYARFANHALPVAIYPEVIDDMSPAIDRLLPGFQLSVPLVAPPAGMANLAEFANRLAGIPSTDVLRERAAEIHRLARGTVTTYADGKQADLKDLTADAFWKALTEGGEWAGPASPAVAPVIRPALHRDQESASDLPLVAIAQPRNPVGSPLMTKLYQESNLHLAPNRVALSPSGAAAGGVSHGGRAILQTSLGKCAVEVTVDEGVPEGAVLVGGSPGIQDVCGPSARAKVVSA